MPFGGPPLAPQIVLPEDVSQERLLLEIRRHRDADGVQVMWPLPAHIDNAAVLDAIPLDQDVDGVHYVGQMEVAGGHVEVKEPRSRKLWAWAGVQWGGVKDAPGVPPPCPYPTPPEPCNAPA